MNDSQHVQPINTMPASTSYSWMPGLGNTPRYNQSTSTYTVQELINNSQYSKPINTTPPHSQPLYSWMSGLTTPRYNQQANIYRSMCINNYQHSRSIALFNQPLYSWIPGHTVSGWYNQPMYIPGPIDNIHSNQDSLQFISGCSYSQDITGTKLYM